MKIRVWAAVAFGIAAAVPACTCDKGNKDGSAASASASAVAPASASASVAAEDAGEHPLRRERKVRRGPTTPFFAAARAQTLEEATKTKIDDIEKKLSDDDPPKGTENKDTQADLIAGVKAGKVDDAKMQAHFAAMEKIAQARLDEEADGLSSLHAALDAAQRKAVAADVKTKSGASRDKEKDAKDKEKERLSAHVKRRLDKLTKELDLDADQQKKVEAILQKEEEKRETRDAHAKKVEDAAAAFEKDTLEAKKLDLFKAAKAQRPQIETEVRVVTALLPVLKPEQRDKLAGQMERRAAPGMRFGRGQNPDRMGFGQPRTFGKLAVPDEQEDDEK